jgi:uncharacterized protein (TIGR03437 family)
MQRHYQTGLYSLYFKILFGLILCSCIVSAQQFPPCLPSAGNANLRSEGLTEVATNLTLSCTNATPGVPATASVIIETPVNITNHLSTNNVPDVVVSVTAAGFQQPVPANIQLVGNNTVNISGIQYTPGADGTVVIKIDNLRVNANSAAGSSSPVLNATILASGLKLTNSQFGLGALASGLLSSQTSPVFYGTPPALPSSLTMQNLFSAGVAFNTTRVTEGFANAFNPKDANSDTGTRIMIRYENLPAGLQLAVPDLVSGSDAYLGQQTAGGDMGVPQSPGAYAPSVNGSLLLALVTNPNPDGSGGQVYGKPTSPTTLSNVYQLPISNGSAMAVYEVVDANPAIQESAQIPTFIGLTSAASAGSYGGQGVSFAPISTVGVADMTDPVPRFVDVTPPGDCKLINDCTANYFPRLQLNTSQVTLSAPAGGTQVVGYVPFYNVGGGTMAWTASVNYQTGSGWLSINPTSGINNSTVNVHANPANLTPGVYNATVTIDAGPAAGSQSVPVVFTVSQALPLITQVSNAANGYVNTLVPGSFASIYGTSLSGSNLSVTFDGVSATTVYTSATQINLLVPSTLTGKSSAQVVVSTNGQNSAPFNVTLANASPAIFPNGVLNQDFSVNSTSNPAAAGSTLQIFVTGLPPVAGATVSIGNQSLQSVFSGPAPGVPGLQQVNVMLPAGLTGTAQLTVCSAAPNAACSPAYSVTIH